VNPNAEHSLSSRAMLCSLSISTWSARKHDRDASEEIAVRHGAQTDSGRYHKLLVPKEALAEVQKIVSEARQEHYFMTLPWDVMLSFGSTLVSLTRFVTTFWT
jgi:hypothetical protein